MKLVSKNYLFIAVFLSIVIHFLILFVGGNILIQPAQFNIQQGADSTEIDLVSSLPAPAETVTKVETPIEKSEEPKTKEAEPVPKVPTKKPSPRVQPKSQPSAKKAHPKLTGKRPAASRSQGARISARPDYLRNPPPRYPEFARQAHQQGTVILRVVVSETGEALAVSIRSSSGFRSLDRAALEAVRNWRFKPGTLGGVPIRSMVEVPVRFQLQ